MNMQDKEFDKIFNSKFEDFEVEPSATVWDNITAGLDGKKTKRSIMPYLSIAATILVVLTAGILFMQKDSTTKQKLNPTKLVANHVEPAIPVIDKKEAGLAVITKPISRVASIAKHQHISVSQANKVTVPVATKVDNAIKQPESVKTDNQQFIAAVIAPPSIAVKATVPDVQLTPTPLETPVEKPTVMASIEKQNTAPVKKHGIRSLGGLINVLIAKVDKREDKLIEFSDSDDDDTESNVTGVNLGVIKIKKQ